MTTVSKLPFPTVHSLDSVHSADVVISMAEPSYSVVENSGEVQVCVELEEGGLEGVNAVVQITTQPGTASESSETHSLPSSLPAVQLLVSVPYLSCCS